MQLEDPSRVPKMHPCKEYWEFGVPGRGTDTAWLQDMSQQELQVLGVSLGTGTVRLSVPSVCCAGRPQC